MSEPILIALVQLFAIVASSRQKQLSDHTRFIIESYLKQYLNSQELQEYLMLYDELCSFHELSSEGSEWANSETLNKMTGICEKINKGLQQKDKIIVFIKFIEFVEAIKKSDAEANQTDRLEFEYYRIVSAAFNLSQTEYKTICHFLLNPKSESIHPNRILIIDNGEQEFTLPYKHLVRERLDSQIWVLYLKSVDLFIGRIMGRENFNLNGHFISQNQSFIISPGSIIKTQKSNPVYYADIASAMFYVQQKVNLEFTAQNIAFSFKDSNNGLKPFSFTAESGELIGVMGASGTGKSTLLSLLNGTLPLNEGAIYINGHHLENEKEHLKGIIGFIPQDDLLIEELTVFQNLYFNAKLCFSDFTKRKLIRTILKVLTDIDLNGIRNLVVGSPLNKVISGGQRKRLNIALELIREPFVLFADEPTSGLSSMDSEMVMLLLKEQTLKGRMVMVNIHQPSSNIFKLFDKLLILDKGGYPVFYGNPIDAVTYFKSASNHVNPTESECISCGYVNPEQLFQITEAKTINRHGKVTNQRITSPADWYQLFKRNIQPWLKTKVNRKLLPKNQFKTPEAFKQFKIFSLRNLLIKLTNRQYLLLNLLEAPLLAFILAYLTRFSTSEVYIFGQNKNLAAYLFMSVIVALFLGMMVSAEEIIKDRKLLKREAFLTLSRFSYLNSKIMFLFVLSAIQTLLYVLIGNTLLGIQGMTFSYWMVLFSTSCFANLIGLNISSALNSVVNIYILIPFILVPQLLLSGVIVPFESLNSGISSGRRVPVVGDLMASRWAFEALAVNQFKNNAYSKHFYQHDKVLANYSFANGYILPALRAKLDECDRNLSLNQNANETQHKLELLRNEFNKLYHQLNEPVPAYVNQLNSKDYDAAVAEKAREAISNLSYYLGVQHKHYYSQRDSIYRSLAQKLGEEGVYRLKLKHFNQNLAQLVENKTTDKSIIEEDTYLVRRKDPIYLEPESKVGRAHFYAPVKQLGNVKIDTFWFNLGAIWLMTGILYVTLWHDSFRRLSVLLERKRQHRKQKQNQ
ncbi:MAG: ABC transporter [Bacteroidetes bacterium HGW-Bacteroidetes-4]|jgi:ABC-type multidrug transport system ATPase subunit|nr:MAG: ABC transporter [Bacteroidetes bacterium HGW-Bacteroidetes-4]